MAPDTRKLEPTATPGIFKRGARYVVVYRDPQGRPRKRFARTLAEARSVKSLTKADVDRGEYRVLSRVTFAEYALDWIDTYAGRTSKGIRDGTRQDYRSVLDRHAVPFFGRMRLSEIEPRDVKRYAVQLGSLGLAPNTVRLSIAPVRALLATAVDEGLIRSNPCTGLRIAQRTALEAEGEQRAKALTEAELRALLAEVPEQWRLLVEFLAHSGLRIGEALALRWGDVDLGRRRVHVRRRLYRGGYAPPKSRYGVRTFPLAAGMARSLWAEKGTAPDEALVFPSTTGGPLNAANVYSRVFKPAARRAGVPWAGFHTLRHTAATMLFRSGLNAKQVQVWLGHHAASFTLDTYIHLLDDELPEPAFLDTLTSATVAEVAEADGLPSALPTTVSA